MSDSWYTHKSAAHTDKFIVRGEERLNDRDDVDTVIIQVSLCDAGVAPPAVIVSTTGLARSIPRLRCCSEATPVGNNVTATNGSIRISCCVVYPQR